MGINLKWRWIKLDQQVTRSESPGRHSPQQYSLHEAFLDKVDQMVGV